MVVRVTVMASSSSPSNGETTRGYRPFDGAVCTHTQSENTKSKRALFFTELFETGAASCIKYGAVYSIGMN